MLSPQKLEEYRAGWRTRRAAREAGVLQRRAEALEKALSASRAIREKYGCRVILFGSLAGTGKFGERSDIDLALDGLSLEANYWRLCSEVMDILHPFEADIVLLETLDPAIKRNILENGIEI